MQLQTVFATLLALFMPKVDFTTRSDINICSGENSVFDIKATMLTPDPPIKGQNLTLSVAGDMNAPLQQGAYLTANVKYGVVKLPAVNIGLCENLKDGCPIGARDNALVEFVFSIPGWTPSGTYDITADMFQKDGTAIACLQSVIVL